MSVEALPVKTMEGASTTLETSLASVPMDGLASAAKRVRLTIICDRDNASYNKFTTI